MKAKRFITVVLSLLMAGSLFVGCGGNDKKPDPEKPGPSQSEDPTVSEVVATANKTEAKVGETVTLSAEVRGTNNPSQAVTWQITAGSDIATLNGAVLTLTGAGTVKVVAKSTADTAKKSNEITITVTAKQGDDTHDPEKPDPGQSETTVSHKIFLAGDSTVKTYEDNQYIGGWGQYLDAFLGDNMTVVNCAQGGRSSRSFINEGRLYDIEGCNYTFSQNGGNSIGDDISKGDYLFIQFGHNDDDTKLVSSASTNYTTVYDRMAPLGTPVNGVYPVTAGTKVSTATLPTQYTQYATAAEQSKALTETAKYGASYYSYDCGGTYKWYLKQYIDFAREKEAIPVLVTPVARVKFSGNQIIGGPGLHGDNFAYVEAVRQLAEEEDCLLIDLFSETKTILETATSTYANYLMALKPNSLTGSWPTGYDTTYGNSSLGYTGIEATHYNKYGAFITAAKVAENILALKDEKHNVGKEAFDFTSSVGAPEVYVDPSNLMSKSSVSAVEGLFKTISVTNPNRAYPDPAEVVSLITTLSAKPVTQENYLQIGEECEAARAAYNNLNVDDRSAVTNINDLVAAEEAVKALVESNRPKPVKVLRFDASSMATATLTAATDCDALVDLGTDESPTKFTVVGSSTKAVDVKASGASFTYAGKDYTVTKCLSMGGSASFNNGRYIEFSVTGKCTITVVAKSSGTDDRTVNLVNSSNSVVASFAANASQSITSNEISTAGTYKMGSAGKGLYIYAIIIEYFA